MNFHGQLHDSVVRNEPKTESKLRSDLILNACFLFKSHSPPPSALPFFFLFLSIFLMSWRPGELPASMKIHDVFHPNLL